MNKEIETVFSYPMRDHQVDVVYLTYEGGAICWEFRVMKGDTELYMSEDGYGQPEAAARDGFGWLLENGDDSAFNVANIIQDDGS